MSVKRILKNLIQQSKIGTHFLNFYYYKFLSEEEFDDYGKFLASLAEFIQAKICVEIGVAHGATTKALCKYIKKIMVMSMDSIFGAHMV